MLPILFTGLLALWLPFYIRTEYKWPQNKFVFTKALSSTLFLLIGITSYIVADAPSSYAFWIIGALILGYIGDILLVYPNILKCFILGLVSFLIGQILYGTVFLSYSGFLYWDVIIYIVVVASCLFAYTKTDLELGPMKIPVLFYLLIISYMYTMAVSTIYKGGFNTITTILIVIGASLFIASDLVLAFVRFQKEPKPYMCGLNLVLYYSAQAILALSIMTV